MIRRLRRTLVSKFINSFRDKRIRRRYVFAEWVPTDANDPNAIQYTTDVMALGGAMQIQYQDGGYRTIYPYGWNTSKDGNVLIMCYKDDGGVRSYRLDRIQQFLFDSSILEQSGESVEETQDNLNPTLDISDYDSVDSEDTLPELPPDDTQNQQVQQELPFDDALDVLEQPMQIAPSSDDEVYYDDVEPEEPVQEEIEEEPKSAFIKKKRLIRKGDLYE